MEVRYGKLENGELRYAPPVIITGGQQIINPSAEILKAQGYKEVITSETPDFEKQYRPVYTENETQIIQSWEEILPTVEQQIFELKERLAATDYQAIKHSEGWICESDYAPMREARQKIRDQINKLEGKEGAACSNGCTT